MVTVIVACSIAAIASSNVFAQPQGGGQMPGGMSGQFPGGMPGFGSGERSLPSVEEVAKQKADLMSAEIKLDEKQYKQVKNLYKQQTQKERDLMTPSFSGMPQGMGGGFPGGGAPSGGGPGMGGGNMGGGMPPMGGGGFSGGGPGMGGGFPGGGAGMGGIDMEQQEKDLEKLHQQGDKKLKKILTPDQYSAWRSKHPVHEAPAMPEVQWKMD